MAKSKIEWTDEVWNPTTGCSKVSAGCANCYAEREWRRLAGNPMTAYYGRKFNDVACHPERLDQPLRWKKPRRIFVNSMSDLFHDDVPFEFVGKVFATMHNYPKHTFMILTKRAERMKDFINWYKHKWLEGFENAWPSEYSHVWLGVSVENQATADERIPLLLQTPAAVRFISAEPLLGPIILRRKAVNEHEIIQAALMGRLNEYSRPVERGIDWVICGGESGPKARPIHPDWVRSLRDQCQAANVPYFFKQWGEWTSEFPQGLSLAHRKETYQHSTTFYRVGKKNAGRIIDGRAWDEMPEVQP